MAVMTNASNGDVTKGEALRRGMASMGGLGGHVDLVAAHCWFNISAVRGSDRAAELRAQAASEMTKPEIAYALQAAREWLRAH